MVTFMNMLKAVLFFFLGAILAYVFPYKIGNIIMGYFDNTTSMYYFLNTMRYLLMFVFFILVPFIFLGKPTMVDKAIKQFGG